MNRQHLIETLKTKVRTILMDRLTIQKRYDWSKMARPAQQIPPGDWRIWLILAGRGFGKTRTGSETIRSWALSGRYRRIALIADTESEGRDVMVEGDSGLLSVHPKNERPLFEPSRRLLTWPNGAIATIYSAENPEKLRGPQFDCAWVDELCKYRNPDDVWAQLNMGLRLGVDPRIIVTTTPKPLKIMGKLIKQAGKSVFLTRGKTIDNARNLAPTYLKTIQDLYGGTRFASQELDGIFTSDTGDALWSLALIRAAACPGGFDRSFFTRLIIAVDPAVTCKDTSDETGIIIAGRGTDGKSYIIKDLSGRYSAPHWARIVVDAYHSFKATTILAEINQGGDLVENMLKTLNPNLPYRGVYARKSKIARAHPIAALYDQGKVRHYPGLETLENQLMSYHPGIGSSSPDRLDAAVWALTDLMLENPTAPPPRAWVL